MDRYEIAAPCNHRCPADSIERRSGTSQRKAQPKKGCRRPPDDSPQPGLGAGVKHLSIPQPGDNPQTDCAHHQQHSVPSARIQALL